MINIFEELMNNDENLRTLNYFINLVASDRNNKVYQSCLDNEIDKLVDVYKVYLNEQKIKDLFILIKNSPSDELINQACNIDEKMKVRTIALKKMIYKLYNSSN